MIRAIIFDLGRVIVPFDFDRAYRKLTALTGLSKEEITGRIRETGLVPLLECGRVEPREFVGGISQCLGIHLSYEQFGELWSSIFLPETLIPESLLAGLKGRYRLLLLSNTNAIHYEMIEANYPLLQHFDDYVLSYRIGAMKPDPRIYRAAVEKSRCAASECFFTDDIPDYVAAARREGIDAVQFESHEQIVGELRSRGVAV